MTRISEFFDGSRIAAVIERVERGEDVDLNRVLALQALDLARLGEMYAVEVLHREDLADGQFAEPHGSRQGSAVWELPGGRP